MIEKNWQNDQEIKQENRKVLAWSSDEGDNSYKYIDEPDIQINSALEKQKINI